MKIRQWLGYNEDASQYLLRPGELRILNNLQSRRPGMLIARKGLTKIYGRYDNEGIYSLYRRATLFGDPSDFLWLQKVLAERELTIAQLDAREPLLEYRWQLRRVEGNKSRVIDTLPVSPNGQTSISNICVAEDRHGRMFLFYGHGARPRLYRPTDIANVAVDMGLDAPSAKPSVAPSGTGYFIESVNVKSGGGAYFEPPALTVEGGSPVKPAKLKAIVQSGNVVGVDIIDGGTNFQTTPTISVSAAKVGSGFRARGNINNSARTLDGFSDTVPGALSGASAPSSAETYGATNGTTGNSILYLSQPRATTEKIVQASGSTLSLASVAGIQVGDIVTVYPAATPFSNSTVTVTAINTSTNVVTISSGAFSPVGGTAYEAAFRRAAVVQQAEAEYDSERRRFTATIPLASSSAGKGAHATLEFSPTPLGYGLDDQSTSSVTVINQNFHTYRNAQGQYTSYLYGELWEGSDYDKAKSAENSRYAGLQASGSRYVRGFSGTVGGKRADVYWPDYSKISVWFCVGTASSNANQWARADVPVTTEIDPGTGLPAKVLKFRLQPTQQGRAVKSLGGASISTDYTPYSALPDAIGPEVKLYLQDCPDSWVANSEQCLPTEAKEANFNRVAWWSAGTNVTRPVVGITPANQAVTASAVTITDAGRGWQQGTVFAFRLYQANPYDQYVDYNTAVVEDAVAVAHAPYESANRYVEFRLAANTPDNLTPHGPPQTLITPALVSLPGDGYTSGQAGTITLYKRALSALVSSATASRTLTWTASVLDTLSATSTGNIASITILNKGRNYGPDPTVEVRGGGVGYGLSVKPNVVNGRIDSVQIIDPGAGYTVPPELFTSSRAAELTPVMRPALRGKYRCAYRFVDMTETLVKTVTGTLGESATTLTLSTTDGVKPGMLLEAAALPHYSRVKSVNGNQVEINQSITGLAAGTSITISVRDLTKPISYSDLSPIADVDAGPNDERTHCSVLSWSIPGVVPPGRATKVELWRTSGDQSLVFYRTEAYGIPTANGVEIVGTDTLTDEQLFDPDRPHYAAMPIVLPNGGVNAYRFGKPRDDLSVAVAFQDRLWMGVSTSGKDANTLFYSEFDEFESVSDVNELPIQNNQKSTDTLTALVPFGSLLLAMQHAHTYAVQYNTDPGVDAAIQMMSHRGCLHQRCWDIHENVLYAADESGIYAMSRNGEVQDVSLPVRNYFVGELLDFSKRETFFLQVDPRTHILRFFCTFKANPTDTPALALCYDIQAKSWWTESYPNSMTAACTGRPDAARINTILLGGADGNLYELASDSDHANDSLTDAFVTEGGSGYREAPTITVPNCEGAVVQGVVSEGRLVDVIIQNAGWEARWGIGILAEDGRPLLSHDAKPLQGVEYDPIRLDIGAPEEGGVQAVAYANFSVTPRVVRTCTVSLGESFVRLDAARITAFEPDSTALIAAEFGATLCAENGAPLRTEPAPVEIGMEAVGDFVPLNSFVSRIDRNDIYLSHPDGTPVSMLFGATRTNLAGTGADYLEEGGTPMVVRFYKPFRTHVPFRMATGFMQLVNEESARGGDNLLDRSVTLVYTPTAIDKDVEIIERFNGREEMRANVIRRDRGGPGGFRHREDSASTVLNTSKHASHLGFSTGVATAKFASRVYTDMTGEDQHLQIELYARPEQSSPWQRTNFWRPSPTTRAAQPFVLHSMAVNGVVADAE
jgi:hypothetical protein